MTFADGKIVAITAFADPARLSELDLEIFNN
jgi:ketosteroid isomerase-like protein